MRLIAGLLAGSLFAACPALAAEADFAACDGYPAPGKKSDGITKDSLFWGLASTSADFRQSDTVFLSDGGTVFCDNALADPLLKPEYVLRRIHLLQSRAMHQIAEGKPADALVTLDQAKTVALEPAALRDKGLGIANMALRAIALGDLGQREAAVAQIEAIQQARRFAPSIQRLAGALRLRLDNSIDAQFTEIRRRLPLDPSGALTGAVEAMLAGRNRDVLSFTDGFVIELPKMRGGWSMEGGGFDDYDLIKLRAFVATMRAYALVAEGQEGAANALLEDTRQDLVAAKVEPVPKAPGKPLSKQQLDDFSRRTAMAQEGEKIVAVWVRLIVLRKQVGTLTPEQLFAQLDAFNRGEVSCLIDLIAHLPRLGPPDEAERAKALKDLTAQLEQERIKELKTDLATILRLLPRPETERNQPNFHGAGDGYFLSDNGYSTKQMGDPTIWTVRFTNALASHATVEEMALVSAATLAKKKGYSGFVVTSNRSFDRTTHVTSYGMYGGGSYDQNSGREAQMVIHLVNAGQFPADLTGAEARFFDADRVIAELSAEYPTIGPKKR